jgi:UDP-glucuronate decarboxylase
MTHDNSVIPIGSATTAGGVVTEDLNSICGSLRAEFPRMAGKRLLITGGAGFLGYYLVQAVLHWNRQQAASEQVCLTVLDNFARGLPQWLEALDDPRLRLSRHDITQPLPSGDGPLHFVIHAASIASPTFYRKHPIATMDANVNGLRRLLDYCRERQEASEPVEGLLFFSSSEVYGSPPDEHIPTPETYPGIVSATGPRACYDESKRYGETLAVNFARHHGLPISIARPFNNYGPGLKITDRRVIPDLVRDALAGRDMILHSDGSPTRTFCYVSDAVVGYYKVLLRGRPGEAYNIGVEEPEVSMLELAEQVAECAREQFGYAGRVIFRPSTDPQYLSDNPLRRSPRIGKARSELGYDPQVSLAEGLRRSLVWYGENREAEDA